MRRRLRHARASASLALRHARGIASMLRHGEDASTQLPGDPYPVVLLHGFATNSRSLLPMERWIASRLGRSVIRFPLAGHWSLHLGDVRASARALHATLEAAEGLQAVDVVGYSLGGLVATYALKVLDRGRRIRRVVTLGTPHRGVPLARLTPIPVTARLCPALCQMVPGSELLRDLDRRSTPAGASLLSVVVRGDRLVPVAAGRIPETPGQRNRVIRGRGHLSIPFSAPMLECMRRELELLPGARGTQAA